MKVVKLLSLGKEFLKIMSFCDLKVEDYKYIEMYSEYVKARQNNEKYTFVIMKLSQCYGISESTVKRIIKRFEKEI